MTHQLVKPFAARSTSVYVSFLTAGLHGNVF